MPRLHQSLLKKNKGHMTLKLNIKGQGFIYKNFMLEIMKAKQIVSGKIFNQAYSIKKS